MVFAKQTQINKKARRGFTRITLTDSRLRFQAKGKKNALLSPLLPATPSGKAAAGCGHPESCRRGWGGGGGLRPPQGSEPEGESPPQELTTQPGRRSHLTTPAQAGHRPKLPPPPPRPVTALLPPGQPRRGRRDRQGGSTSQRRL